MMKKPSTNFPKKNSVIPCKKSWPQVPGYTGNSNGTTCRGKPPVATTSPPPCVSTSPGESQACWKDGIGKFHGKRCKCNSQCS